MEAQEKREILIILLCDNDVNIGVMILQMQKFASIIKKEIEQSGTIKDTLKMTEKELKRYISG